MTEAWEEAIVADTFPEAGEVYFLRPRGNVPNVVEREGNYGKYYLLSGTFWVYSDQNPEEPSITTESPFLVHQFRIKPGVLHDFLGKWDDTKVYHCKCETMGKSKRLKIIKTYVAPQMHSEPATPPPQEPEASQPPIQTDERPPALPPVCSHPPMDRTYTSATVYICGKCDLRVVVVPE